MVNFCAVCGCCTRTDIVREHLEDTLRICDVSAMGLYDSWSNRSTLLTLEPREIKIQQLHIAERMSHVPNTVPLTLYT